jgi:hypothetical protein
MSGRPLTKNVDHFLRAQTLGTRTPFLSNGLRRVRNTNESGSTCILRLSRTSTRSHPIANFRVQRLMKLHLSQNRDASCMLVATEAGVPSTTSMTFECLSVLEVEKRRRHLLQECSETVAAIMFISFVSAFSAGGTVAPRTRACTDLRIGAEGSSAAAGEASMVFLVANAGSSCTLGGYPKVTFWGAKGNVIATSKIDPHSSSMRSVKFTLDHDSVASFDVTWTDIPVRSLVSHQATGATVVLSKGALARYSVFSVEELLYGNSLGVSPLRLGPTP